MRFREVVPGLSIGTRRGINVYALGNEGATTLIDTGEPGFARAILTGLRDHPPVRDIVLTHAHYDHAGGAAEIAAATGATVWMHAADAGLMSEGRWRRPARPSPTMHGPVLKRLFADRYPDRLPRVAGIRSIPPTGIIPVAAGIGTTGTPGHSAGQVALSWTGPGGDRVVFAADAVMNLFGPREPILYEDRAEGLHSIARLADVAQGADVMTFGHGRPTRLTSSLLRRLHTMATDGSRSE